MLNVCEFVVLHCFHFSDVVCDVLVVACSILFLQNTPWNHR